MCVCLRARVWALAGTRTCVRVCQGAHDCALEGKGCGAHVRTRVSTRVRACEGAHVRVCVCVSVCMRVRLWASLCALAGVGTRAGARARV